MKHRIFSLLFLLHRLIDRQFTVKLRFCRAQTKIAMDRDRMKQYILTPRERQWLLSIGAEINHEVKDLLVIVTWRTYQRWVREGNQGAEPGQIGRKRSITQEAIDLVLRMARENSTWGKLRIVGELKKLAIRISSTSVLRILRQAGLEPAPDKGDRAAPVVPWSTFVSAHLESMVATDFFTKTIWTWHGRVSAYCLFFIHLGSRKVYCSPVTLNPDEEWVMQQARNAAIWMEDEGIKPRFVIHDRDTKYTARFDDFFRQVVKEQAAPKQGQVIKTMVRVPQMNGYAESFVAAIKRTVLDHFVGFSLPQVDYLIQTFLDHYHVQRPHQGKDIGNQILDPTFVPIERGAVRSTATLGGLLRHYYRDAA